jgi:hypothetical protein
MMLSTLALACSLAAPATLQDPYAEYKKDLVPIGKQAPQFLSKDDADAAFDFHKTIKESKAKATILNFWFAH